MDPIQLAVFVALSSIALGCGWTWIKEASELRKYWRRQ